MRMLACLLALALYATAAADEMHAQTWSAAALLGVAVRGVDRQLLGRVEDLVVDRNGHIAQLVVEAGALFSRHYFALPWAEVRLMPALAYVAVPLTRDSVRDYEVAWSRLAKARGDEGAWRLQQLLHDHASLRDVPNIGFVRDALFDVSGQVKQVIVSNFYESYGYPFFGYNEEAGGYLLPYASAQMDGLAPLEKPLLSEPRVGRAHLLPGPF
jgi:hypothetical protein